MDGLEMTLSNDYIIFYLSVSKNRALLQILMQNPLPMSLETLQKKLRGIVKSRADLLKCLKSGEMLQFIEKHRNYSDNFQYRVTSRGKKVLKKYLELLEAIGSNEKCIIETSRLQ